MTREEGKQIERASIMHLAPTSGLQHANCLGIVDEVLSWGVKVWVPGVAGIHSVAWSNCEPTGGRAIWDQAGQPYPPAEKPLRHHP